jgi:hypothetical protein
MLRLERRTRGTLYCIMSEAEEGGPRAGSFDAGTSGDKLPGTAKIYRSGPDGQRSAIWRIVRSFQRSAMAPRRWPADPALWYTDVLETRKTPYALYSKMSLPVGEQVNHKILDGRQACLQCTDVRICAEHERVHLRAIQWSPQSGRKPELPGQPHRTTEEIDRRHRRQVTSCCSSPVSDIR